MRIKILRGYRGTSSKGKYFPAGEYTEEDLGIDGLSAYLVKNSHAVVVEDKQEEPKAVEPTDAAKALAEEHNIDLNDVEGTGQDGRITKDDVLKAINDREEEDNANQPEGDR